MGSWATNAKTKTERSKEILTECVWENEIYKSILISKRVTNTGLWTLQTITTGDVQYHVLTFHKMSTYKGQWWVKSMTIDSGPFYYDCPKKLVEKWLKLRNNVFYNDWESQWYEKWKNFEHLWDQIRELKHGDQVIVGSRNVTFKYWYNNKVRNFVGIDNDTNTLYRWTTGNITKILEK